LGNATVAATTGLETPEPSTLALLLAALACGGLVVFLKSHRA
jgi:hypothetical protein